MLTAKYQIEAANTSQTAENQSNDKNKSAILSEYEQLWLNNAELPNDAQLWAAWYSQGGRTKGKSLKKAEMLFGKMIGLEIFAKELEKVDGEDEQVASSFSALSLFGSLKNPANLKTLAESLPLIDGNTNKIIHKFAVVLGFLVICEPFGKYE